MTKKDNPCYGCKDRCVGCHSECESYSEYSDERKRMLKEKEKYAYLYIGKMCYF